MRKIIDLTGKIFGMLTVLHLSFDSHGTDTWTCFCECGNFKDARGNKLKSGHTKSCGCLKSKTLRSHLLKPDLSNESIMYSNNMRLAIRRGISFLLSLEQFSYLIRQSCHYCGSQPKNRKVSEYRGSTPVNGIDRKDSNSDYTPENCVPCCTFCNYAKRDKTYEEFVSWMGQLIKYRTNLEKL